MNIRRPSSRTGLNLIGWFGTRLTKRPKTVKKSQKNKGRCERNAKPLVLVFQFGADERIRTAGLLITNQLLYRLSYVGETLC